MGMFDRIYINCPHCKKEIEFQTKAGDCTLATFYPQIEKMPKYLLTSVFNNNQTIYCEYCGEPYLISFDPPSFIKITVRKRE